MSRASITAFWLVYTGLLRNLETWNLRTYMSTNKNCAAATSFWQLMFLMKRKGPMWYKSSNPTADTASISMGAGKSKA